MKSKDIIEIQVREKKAGVDRERYKKLEILPFDTTKVSLINCYYCSKISTPE